MADKQSVRVSGEAVQPASDLKADSVSGVKVSQRPQRDSPAGFPNGKQAATGKAGSSPARRVPAPKATRKVMKSHRPTSNGEKLEDGIHGKNSRPDDNPSKLRVALRQTRQRMRRDSLKSEASSSTAALPHNPYHTEEAEKQRAFIGRLNKGMRVTGSELNEFNAWVVTNLDALFPMSCVHCHVRSKFACDCMEIEDYEDIEAIAEQNWVGTSTHLARGQSVHRPIVTEMGHLVQMAEHMLAYQVTSEPARTVKKVEVPASRPLVSEIGLLVQMADDAIKYGRLVDSAPVPAAAFNLVTRRVALRKPAFCAVCARFGLCQCLGPSFREVRVKVPVNELPGVNQNLDSPKTVVREPKWYNRLLGKERSSVNYTSDHNHQIGALHRHRQDKNGVPVPDQLIVPELFRHLRIEGHTTYKNYDDKLSHYHKLARKWAEKNKVDFTKTAELTNQFQVTIAKAAVDDTTVYNYTKATDKVSRWGKWLSKSRSQAVF